MNNRQSTSNRCKKALVKKLIVGPNGLTSKPSTPKPKAPGMEIYFCNVLAIVKKQPCSEEKNPNRNSSRIVKTP